MAKMVLVVDDDLDFLELMEDVLSRNGYKIVPCPVAMEAYGLARKVHPNAIVVDLLMPEIDGWQVIERLAEDPATANIPIVVCTAAVPHLTRLYAAFREMGCDILLKPFELDDLLLMLAKVTAQRNVG